MTGTAAKRLDGRRIILFGGGSGIGKATAELFAREGARLAIVDHDRTAATAVAEAVGGVAIAADISDAPQVKAAVDGANAALEGIDGLVNTAGVFDPADLENTAPDLWNQVIGINLTGTYLVCRHALPHLRRAAPATIVTLGSGVALVPTGPTSAAYVAAKGGVIALTRQMAMEAAPLVRANCVCPGMVDTPMTRTILRDDTGETRSSITGSYALKRAAAPGEIAAAILFLTSRDSSYVTGTAMAVDGGRTFH
ncbi:SDR family NAD(P)-dependent oxidoreductase [Ruixingdingia sedimenti]|uniref:SDR family NAD(P)-dependent oxidoreductase n=1 Tax=Ruixingdingia sedimenti TaxID=3073604 RepID=A0ABU1FD59_9RHOB|nr:SDR family NAD(P)-dependent oxidoreductase [Xinfangfangia sp. LG-4]MDR5654801.1 SDR family NAD(P)-dependent oxidoreductase [Xinfangfangia sp. LG-4]